MWAKETVYELLLPNKKIFLALLFVFAALFAVHFFSVYSERLLFNKLLVEVRI
jgi:hypothetical protein